MSISRRIELLLASACLVFFSGTGALADCTCSAPATPKEAYGNATAVFVGRVERVAKSPLRPGFNEARFALLRRFKGLEEISANFVMIYTTLDTGNCGYTFIPGQDYIVYAAGSPAAFKTDTCSRTGILDNYLDDVETLSKLAGK